ncbi:molecular chaperone [Entomohabitans teleogrylli]|uniref:fimbrial biogenesis chaperone n=1 Tax=Entomohabitans teleogrylli TaxID=1384589 RepID=UPI00073D1DE7|nr:fimbria/pilus periplasmic chaperone [Entomohabitans teleogrylli]
MNLRTVTILWPTIFLLITSTAEAALSVERSRIIFNEGDKAVSLGVTNNNTQDPYLAQAWMENEKEEKISGPFMILPPVQRVEAGSKTRVRIQAATGIATLPGDRESVFWLNLREIPPKSDKPNVLMLAMQTRMKVFWRPKSIKVDPSADTVPGTSTLTLALHGGRYEIHNPTPYHFSFVEVRNGLHGKGLANFEPVMVEPKGKATLPVSAAQAGNTPVLMFINDYGSARLLPFRCSGTTCTAGKVEMPGEKN